MARKVTGWTCRKASCKFRNPPRTRKCQSCGKARPVKKAPAHSAVLKVMSYEDFIVLNGGEHCAVCELLGRNRIRLPGQRRFDRDHDHQDGHARGLLCRFHNRLLPHHLTLPVLRAFVTYMERTDGNLTT